MAEHTPGPWITGIVDSWDGKCVYRWIGPGPDRSNAVATQGLIGVRGKRREQLEANTRLIAAAPDLLAACEAGLEALTVSSPECEASTIADARKRRDAKQLLRVAIAKAKGVA